MKPLFITLVFFSSLVCAQDYREQPYLRGDGSLDDPLVNFDTNLEQKKTIRIINKSELEKKYKREAEEAMQNFEETGDLYNLDY